jgi:hypothetical protein
MCVYVLCFILIPLGSGKNPFAVQLNNNKKNPSSWISKGEVYIVIYQAPCHGDVLEVEE